MMRDLQFVLRQLRRAPGFTLTAVLTLGLGIGATTAVYNVVRTVLLSPLPYPDPDRLVGVAFTFPHEEPNAEQTGLGADFVRAHSDVFASSAVLDDNSPVVNLSVSGGHAVQETSLRVSEGYFRTLGVLPALGRNFTQEEDRAGGPPAVILSDTLWSRMFGRNPGILGKSVRINQENFTVVGVMPAAFSLASETSQGNWGTASLWMPIKLGPKDPGYDGDNYEMIARLRPGVTLQRAQQELATLADPFFAQYPQYKRWFSRGNELHQFRAWKLQETMVARSRSGLLALMGAVMAVLLVACLNLSGLTLARTMRRMRELSVRTALGATRAQLLRLLGCEGLVLAAAGGILAVLISSLLTGFLLHAGPLHLPLQQGNSTRWLASSLLVAILSLAATILFAVLPGLFVILRRKGAARLSGPSLGENLSHARISRALMVAQVAVGMVLLFTASLLMGSFLRMRSLPSGVEPKQLSVFQVALKGDRYANTKRNVQFISTVLEHLRQTPGVERVAAINGLPLDRGLNIGGNPADRRDLRGIVEFRAITPGYFETMGMHLLAGRAIESSDRDGGDRVIVIGATTAKKWWPGRSPIGERISVGGEHTWRVVGVVSDAQMHTLVEAQGIVIYAPFAQLSDEMMGIMNGWFPTTFAMRTAARVDLAQSVQRAVEAADAEIPVARLETMTAVIDSTIEAPRFFSLLAASFSGFSLLLTVVGIFGLLSYQVTQRTKEIGVRMALGADRGTVLRAIMSRGMVLTVSGAALGVAGSLAVQTAIGRLLVDMGIPASEGSQNVLLSSGAAVCIAVGAVLLATLGASWLPARRAASIEPMQALRTE